MKVVIVKPQVSPLVFLVGPSISSRKELDEKVARLHFLALGEELTVFAQEQAFPTGVKSVNVHVDALCKARAWQTVSVGVERTSVRRALRPQVLCRQHYFHKRLYGHRYFGTHFWICLPVSCEGYDDVKGTASPPDHLSYPSSAIVGSVHAVRTWRCLRFSYRQCGGHSCVATETGTMAFPASGGASASFHQQCGGHSCLVTETDHASHLQRTTRGHFDPNVLESTEVSAVPAEVTLRLLRLFTL